jgi:hypothetical protein
LFFAALMMPRKRRGQLGGSLPTMKVHRRHQGTDGVTHRTTTEQIWQPCMLSESSVVGIIPTAEPVEPSDVPSGYTDADDGELTSKYEQLKKNEVKKWAGLRKGMLSAAWDCACPPTNIKCLVCRKPMALTLRCITCGPFYFVCEMCGVQDHVHRPLHSLEAWHVRIIVIRIFAHDYFFVLTLQQYATNLILQSIFICRRSTVRFLTSK